jgi:hypothetical protein
MALVFHRGLAETASGELFVSTQAAQDTSPEPPRSS